HVEDTLSLIEKLKRENITVLAIEQAENSTKLNTFFPQKGNKYAIVMGNEVKGVQQEVVNASDLCIEISQLGTKHSLNISVTTGIVLWDLFQKLQ
ncbi:TrmH family RNA methyltransferase, partial [Polaribacter sp.]|nr:TrmH family RNA methyltransferase [Polaribacter sp.]